MAVDYTTTGMITAINLRVIMPTSQNLYTNDRIILMMTEELIAEVVPLIISAKQEYLVHSYDQTIAAAQNSVFIPFRAVGLKLRDCVLVDSGGQEIPLRRYEPEDLKNGFQKTVQYGFYVDNDRIILLPTDGAFAGYTFRSKIFRRPNRLIRATAAAQITAINTGTNTVTCSSIPSAFTTTLTYDLIKGTPSFRAHGEALAVTSIVSTDIIFSATLPSDLTVGDWIAETGFSPIPQIPYDLFPLLEQRVVIKALESMKDKTGMELAKETYKEMCERAGFFVQPRVDGSNQKVVSRRGVAAYNRSGPRGYF